MRSHYAALAGLVFTVYSLQLIRDLPASPFRVLGLEECITTLVSFLIHASHVPVTLIKKKKKKNSLVSDVLLKLGVVVCVCDLRAWEAEAGGAQL